MIPPSWTPVIFPLNWFRVLSCTVLLLAPVTSPDTKESASLTGLPRHGHIGWRPRLGSSDHGQARDTVPGATPPTPGTSHLGYFFFATGLTRGRKPAAS